MARSGYGARARRAVRAVPRRAVFLDTAFLKNVFPVTTACLALVAGCGLLPAAPGTADSAGQSCGSGITFAIGPDDIGWLTPIINRWNKGHPSDQVQPLYLPQAANGQLAQLVADLQARSCLYDVIDMDVVWTAQFASSGWIIPLKGFSTSGFLAPAVDTARYAGQLYAVPDYTNADLLYYRTDLVKKPPTTWGQLAADAQRLRREDHLDGYAATLAPYEGLTVNFTEAQQSKGGSFLAGHGSTVTVNSRQATAALQFLVNGIKAGWIPQQDRTYEETQVQDEFLAGKFVFLNMWPDVYTAATTAGPGNKVYGKVGVTVLPGPSALGGANLAISAYSRHPAEALDFIKFLTDAQNERVMFTKGGFPPVRADLYHDPGLRARYPDLKWVLEAVNHAQPRPAVTTYEQASQAIFGQAETALRQQETPQQAIKAMTSQLARLIGGG
jgi:multiple sugar transport system substrate-binding protein